MWRARRWYDVLLPPFPFGDDFAKKSGGRQAGGLTKQSQVRAAEDILALTRVLKEAWLFGKLDAVGTSQLEERTELASRKVVEGLVRLAGEGRFDGEAGAGREGGVEDGEGEGGGGGEVATRETGGGADAEVVERVEGRDEAMAM